MQKVTQLTVLSSLLTVLVSFTLYGQIVLDQSDLPSVGDTSIMVGVDSAEAATLSPGSAGANISWDFSSLSEDGGYSTIYVDPATTPCKDTFPEADIATIESFGYGYYIMDTLGQHLMGQDYSWTEYCIHFDDPVNLFPLLSFSDTLNHGHRQQSLISSDSLRVYHGVMKSIADGWGTVQTPSGPSNAIRVHTLETVYDSLYINGVGQLVDSMVQYYYDWYTKGLGWAVLKFRSVAWNNYVQEVFYSEKSGTTGIKNSSYNHIVNNRITISPNPFSRATTITLHGTVHNRKVELGIYNVLGKEVHRVKYISSDKVRLERGNLPAGVFFYRLNSSKEQIGKGKIIIE